MAAAGSTRALRARARCPRLSGLLAALVTGLLLAAPACAAGDTARLESLSAMLHDPAQRDAFVGHLDDLIEQQQARAGRRDDGGRGALAQLVGGISTRLEAVAGQFGVLLEAGPELLHRVTSQGRDPQTLRRWGEGLARIVLVVALGLLTRSLVERLLARFARVLTPRAGEPVLLRFVRSAGVLIHTLIGLAAGAAAALALLPALDPAATTRLLAVTLVQAIVCERAISVSARRLLVPNDPSARLVPCSDDDASYWYVWLRRLAGIAIYGYAAAAGGAVLGLAPVVCRALLHVTGLVLTVLTVVLILQNRHRVSAWLRRPRQGRARRLAGLRRIFADTWAGLAIFYVLACYAIWALGTDADFAFLARASAATLAIGVAARALVLGGGHLLCHAAEVPRDLELRFPGLSARVNRYLPAARAALAGLVYAFAFLLVLDAWGVDTLGWLRSDAGAALVGHCARIGGVLLAAMLGYEGLSLAIVSYLEAHEADASGRARTLLPLLRNGAMVVIVAVALLMVFSELGIDITPLLAGAGVFGLAIGFGAQNLVKDVITGMFILIEDTLSIGDIVDVGGTVGMVESMTIRTMRLRDLDATVHTIPFGEVSTISNMTKDYAYALMDIGVAYREDVDAVIEVMRAVAEEMRDSDDYGRHILEPLEVMGLDSFADSAVVIRIRLMTTPLERWWIKREYQRHLKRRFDELDIEIPFPHQTLYFGVDKDGEAPAARLRMLRERAGAPAHSDEDEPAPVPGATAT
ncbi:MAG: mechanosensitive ion channel [Gammaproteobacteria bacterium]|nr:mechanosensitive ion channel [Gammaproteobacteria bacterium]